MINARIKEGDFCFNLGVNAVIIIFTCKTMPKDLKVYFPAVRADTSSFIISSLGFLKSLTLISSSFTTR